MSTQPQPFALAADDIEQIFQLFSQVTDPTASLTIVERKRKLLERVTQLIDADVYVWSAAILNPPELDVMTTQVIDGGWESEEQRVLAIKAMLHPQVNEALAPHCTAVTQSMRHTTLLRSELLSNEWMHQHCPTWHLSGVDYSLFSLYPLNHNSYSAVGLHRRLGKPNFTQREISMVHLLFRHVEWFHRRNVEPEHSKVLLLSPRERQTLLLLLGGDTKRAVAEKLGISEHTVGDYTKNIYKHFGVNSRGALQAYFMSSQAPSIPKLDE